MIEELIQALKLRMMHYIKSNILRIVAGVFVFALVYACNSVEDKQDGNDEVQDADKTEMMEEEHQMDPQEGEMMEEDNDSLQTNDEVGII